MSLSPSKINTFLFFKLPSAWWCGVRLKEIDANRLSTGALVMNSIRAKGKPVSMLVANNKATFTKKATGRIYFECLDGQAIAEAIDKTIATGEGQTQWMKSVGKNEDGIIVSEFHFEWTVKLKSKR